MPALSMQDPFLRATATNFFFFLSLNCFVLLPLHIHAIGGTEVEIGIVMGLYNATGILCQPLFGPWADAAGRRPFMILGVGLTAAAALLATVAPTIGVLAVVRVLQGVGFSAFFVAMFSHVIDLVEPARRGWALGIFGVSGLLATAVAPLFGEVVIRRLGFRPLAALSLLLGLMAAGFVWRLGGSQPQTPTALRGSLWLQGGLREAFHLHMAVTLFFGLGSGTIFVFLPTFAEHLGVRTLALFYTAYSVAAMGVRIFGGRLIDTQGRRAVIVPSMFLQAAATSLLASLGFLTGPTGTMPILPVLFVAGLMSGAAHGFLYPGLAALVTDHTPPTRRAAVVGVFSAVFLVGQSLGSFVFGYVTHALGYGRMWSVLTVLLLIGSALSLRLAQGPRAADRK